MITFINVNAAQYVKDSGSCTKEELGGIGSGAVDHPPSDGDRDPFTGYPGRKTSPLNGITVLDQNATEEEEGVNGGFYIQPLACIYTYYFPDGP